MADKKITDLTLIGALTDAVNLAVDDTIQSYRATMAQIKNHVLAAGNVARSALADSEKFPIGAPIAFCGTVAPTGWLLCDGSAVSRITYADLYAVMGDVHGEGDGSTTFNLPDYRGRFLRGVADGQSTDPDRSSRTAMNTGGNIGDNVGSVQDYATARPNSNFTTNSDTHNHEILPFASGNAAGAGNFLQGTVNNDNYGSRNTGNDSHSHSVTGGGDNETRPTNAYVNFIIKF